MRKLLNSRFCFLNSLLASVNWCAMSPMAHHIAVKMKGLLCSTQELQALRCLSHHVNMGFRYGSARALTHFFLSLFFFNFYVSRKLLEDCCDPGQLFVMTKLNSPMGKNLWFDGEFLYSFTIDNTTYSLFPQVGSFLFFSL